MSPGHALNQHGKGRETWRYTNKAIDLRTPESKPLKVLIWGTYDLGKPRTRLVIEAIRSSGAIVTEVHKSVW